MTTPPRKKFRRIRVFADPKVQTALCIRIGIYWISCQAVMVCTMLYLAALDEGGSGGSLMRLITPALIVSGCLLPLAIVDILILSNRVVGPIRNFRNRFHKLVHEDAAEEISFRSGDYYKELQEDFNLLCQKHNRMIEQADAACKASRELVQNSY